MWEKYSVLRSLYGEKEPRGWRRREPEPPGLQAKETSILKLILAIHASRQ